MEHTEGIHKARKYHSTIRNYTLALLNAFNGVKYWVEQDGRDEQKEFTVPISFGNYEKAINLSDLSAEDIKKGNFNFLPRLVLSFEGMSKAADRQTNKFQKFFKRVFSPDDTSVKIDTSYNSLAYDYHFTLLLQTRGLTIASQITEEMLSFFNPSLNLEIKEFPIFPEATETQILISDPAFEIMDELDTVDINLFQVTFDLTVRGNVYSPIEISGLLETIKLFTFVWDKADTHDAKLADYYRFDISPDTGKIFQETKRSFNASRSDIENTEGEEQTVIDNREDYKPHEVTSVYEEDEYNQTD